MHCQNVLCYKKKVFVLQNSVFFFIDIIFVDFYVSKIKCQVDKNEHF